MAFLDGFGKKMAQAAQAAVEKSKDLAGIAKLNMDIAGQEREIEKTYKQIGEWYYKKFGVSGDPEAAEPAARIRKAEEKIDQLKAELAAQTGENEDKKPGKACPICGERAEEGAKFCPSCGAQMEFTAAPPETDTKTEE